MVHLIWRQLKLVFQNERLLRAWCRPDRLDSRSPRRRSGIRAASPHLFVSRPSRPPCPAVRGSRRGTPMNRRSGYADGLLSGATWGVVAVLLPGAERLSGASLPATATAVAAVFDAAAAVFMLARSGVVGALGDVVQVLGSRRVLAVGACSLLGGPLFMGGYVAAVLLAGPSDALTVTATYPVLGALLARPLLGQRLDRVGWLGVVATAAGATLIAGGASSLIGIGVALVAAAPVA